ncbi:hypothetical protein BDV27DRAFT_85238, partial [Aspergillus caelatus]
MSGTLFWFFFFFYPLICRPMGFLYLRSSCIGDHRQSVEPFRSIPSVGQQIVILNVHIVNFWSILERALSRFHRID